MESSDSQSSSSVNELDFMLLLNTLEKLGLFCCSWPDGSEQEESNTSSSERTNANNDASRLLDIVTSVFSAEGQKSVGNGDPIVRG